MEGASKTKEIQPICCPSFQYEKEDIHKLLLIIQCVLSSAGTLIAGTQRIVLVLGMESVFTIHLVEIVQTFLNFTTLFNLYTCFWMTFHLQSFKMENEEKITLFRALMKSSFIFTFLVSIIYWFVLVNTCYLSTSPQLLYMLVKTTTYLNLLGFIVLVDLNHSKYVPRSGKYFVMFFAMYFFTSVLVYDFHYQVSNTAFEELYNATVVEVLLVIEIAHMFLHLLLVNHTESYDILENRDTFLESRIAAEDKLRAHSRALPLLGNLLLILLSVITVFSLLGVFSSSWLQRNGGEYDYFQNYKEFPSYLEDSQLILQMLGLGATVFVFTLFGEQDMLRFRKSSRSDFLTFFFAFVAVFAFIVSSAINVIHSNGDVGLMREAAIDIVTYVNCLVACAMISCFGVGNTNWGALHPMVLGLYIVTLAGYLMVVFSIDTDSDAVVDSVSTDYLSSIIENIAIGELFHVLLHATGKYYLSYAHSAVEVHYMAEVVP